MDQLLQVDPAHTNAMVAMGDMEAANKAWAAAMVWYKKACMAAPQDTRLQLLVAEAKFGLGEHRAALEMLLPLVEALEGGGGGGGGGGAKRTELLNDAQVRPWG